MKGEQAVQLRLPQDALKHFRYLNRSGCTAIAGTDDAADFQLVQHAMDAVNIDKKSQARLHTLSMLLSTMCPGDVTERALEEVHSLLWCGNMGFLYVHRVWYGCCYLQFFGWATSSLRAPAMTA